MWLWALPIFGACFFYPRCVCRLNNKYSHFQVNSQCLVNELPSPDCGHYPLYFSFLFFFFFFFLFVPCLSFTLLYFTFRQYSSKFWNYLFCRFKIYNSPFLPFAVILIQHQPTTALIVWIFFAAHTNAVNSLSFHPTGNYLVSASNDTTLKVSETTS